MSKALPLKNDQYSPQVAVKLLDHVESVTPELRDLTLIPKLFTEYCIFKGVKEKDFAVTSFITGRKRHRCVVFAMPP